MKLSFSFTMNSDAIESFAELFKLNFFSVGSFVFSGGVIFITTFLTLKGNDVAHSRSSSRNMTLGNDVADVTCAYGTATFANSEFEALVHGNRCNQFNFQSYVIARHDHLASFFKND